MPGFPCRNRVKSGTKNRCMIEATPDLRRKLTGKIKFGAFPKRQSVHEFYLLKGLITLEQVHTPEWWKKIRILISKTATIGCCKLSLYANESCDEKAVYFRRRLK